MRLKKWEQLPPAMQTEAVRGYYDVLQKKRWSLFCKRVFDIAVSLLLLLLLLLRSQHRSLLRLPGF